MAGNSASSHEISRDLGITQKSARFDGVFCVAGLLGTNSVVRVERVDLVATAAGKHFRAFKIVPARIIR